MTANSLMLNAALRSTPHSKESFDYDNDFEDDTVHQHDEFEIGDGAEQRQEEQGATITSSADAEMGHAASFLSDLNDVRRILGHPFF